MTKATTPCFTPRIPPASLSTITIHTQRQSRSASLGSRYYYKIEMHSSYCGIEDFVETHLCKQCVILRSRVSYHGIMHVVAEAGSVCACPLLRREHAANIWPSLCWPWVFSWVETSRNALETSLRGQTRGAVCVGSDASDQNID